MAQIRLRIVGESVIEVGSKRITPTSPHLFAVLLYLGVEHDREVPRTELIELLYPASDAAADSAHRLRQLLYKLRGMGAPVVFTDRAVKVEGGQVRSDAVELSSGSWEGRRERLGRSIDVLPHYTPPVETPLGGWVEQLREKLHNALRQQLTRDMDVARRKADWRYLDALARRTMELDPLNESAVLALAEATARTGSKARAISILDAYRAELGEERASLALPASLLARRIQTSIERQHSVLRKNIPLIGRERELAILTSQWESTRAGNAHLLWLAGNKSIGKSRLAEELAVTAHLSGPSRVVTFSLSPVDAERPLSLIAAFANHLSSLPGAAGCDPASLHALGRLSGAIRVPGKVNSEDAHAPFSDAAVRNAICDLIGCVCDERPVLVIADDAQYLDEASSRILDAIIHQVSHERLLVVLCSTDQRLRQHSAHSILRLEPLSARAARELWDFLLSAMSVQPSEELSDKCLDAAGGNPGHMELLAQQAARDPDQFLIPIDLLALTDRRLNQLPSNARYVLDAIVLLEDIATASTVAHLTGLATYDLLTCLDALESSDLIVNEGTGLRCRSGLIAERVRSTSSAAVTSLMQWRTAEYLEKQQPGDRWSPSTAWRIASHWQRAGEPGRARAYLRACWQHAVSVGQPTSACLAIRDSLATAADPEERASLLDDLIGALQAAGDKTATIPVIAERRSLSSRVHDSPARIAELAFDDEEAQCLKDSDPGLHVATLRTHLQSPLINPRRRMSAARMLIIAADLSLDRQLAAEALAGCDAISPDDPASHLLQQHVSLIFHTVFGDRDTAIQIADRVEQEVKGLERSWYTLISHRNCALARQLAGSGPSDYQSLERGHAQAIDASMTVVAFGFAAYLASLFIDDGDLPNAHQWIRICERYEQSCGGTDLPFDYFGAQIDLSLLEGNARKAHRYLHRLETSWSRSQSQRIRNDLRIYRLRVQQHAGLTDVSESLIRELISFHELAKGLTRHDDHMEVLWTALVGSGETERASLLLSNYLRCFRRERRKCRHVLRCRTQADPAWSKEQLGA